MIFDKFKKKAKIAETKAQTESEKIQDEVSIGFKKIIVGAQMLDWTVTRHSDRYDGMVIGTKNFLEYVIGNKKAFTPQRSAHDIKTLIDAKDKDIN